jgi:hypothetical protein
MRPAVLESQPSQYCIMAVVVQLNYLSGTTNIKIAE